MITRGNDGSATDWRRRAWLAAWLLGFAAPATQIAAPPPPPLAAPLPAIAVRPAEELILGTSTALTGPAADLGRGMTRGIELALAEARRSGGVGGRDVRLVALDDGYEPERAGPNVRRLVDQEHVLAIVGNVGTPTAVAALPIVRDAGIVYYGAFTGAGLLREDPPDPLLVNFRASYAEELAEMVDALVDTAGVRVEEIAFFTQRDSYGDAGFAGGLAALRRHGLADEKGVVHVRYERNTVAVEKALAEVLLAQVPPRAILMIGTYQPCAAFIRLARANGVTARFLNVSFVGSAPLARALGADGDGVIVTQVVPHFDADLPAVHAYRQALAELAPDAAPDFTSLEGFLATRVLLRALATIPGRADREAVRRALDGLGEFDLGVGVPLRVDAEHRQACHRVWPTILRQGAVVPFDWRELAAGR